MASVDLLALEQLVGDQRGLREPARVLLTKRLAHPPGENLAGVGAHVADEYRLGVACRAVAELVGEEEALGGGGGDDLAAVGDGLQFHALQSVAAG